MKVVGISETNDVQINVLGHFQLRRNGQKIDLPAGAARLAALLAVRRHPMARLRIATLLWPGSSPAAARTDLRCAVHQLRRGCPRALNVDGKALLLDADTYVDLHEAERLSNCLSVGTWSGDARQALRLLCEDVLADWTDDWLSDFQAQHRMNRGLALERLSEMLSRDRRHGAAVDAALLSVAADPLRESAWLALVRAHVCEGNFGQALSEVDRFGGLLMQELGECVHARFLREVASLVRERQLPLAHASHQASSAHAGWGCTDPGPGEVTVDLGSAAPVARR
jgi:DNA-binding SARP family transcriptional activator